jgi:hypothetical protein
LKFFKPYDDSWVQELTPAQMLANRRKSSTENVE